MTQRIDEVIRRDIVDYLLLARKPWHGRLDLIGFLKRIWNLVSMKSQDDRFENAEGDIWQHMVRNSDWEDAELLYERLELLNCSDQRFLKFLEVYVHPLADRDDDRRSRVVKMVNAKLTTQGFTLALGESIGDHPVYVAKQVKGKAVKEYEVVLSFAGEDRRYVKGVATELDRRGVSYFYDSNEEAALWGKDLVEHLDYVYRSSARYCVMFLSKHYLAKIWPRQERRSAFARAVEDRIEYILPARFDDTEIPGLRSTIAFIDLRKKSPEQLAALIVRKLGRDTE